MKDIFVLRSGPFSLELRITHYLCNSSKRIKMEVAFIFCAHNYKDGVDVRLFLGEKDTISATGNEYIKLMLALENYMRYGKVRA